MDPEDIARDRFNQKHKELLVKFPYNNTLNTNLYVDGYEPTSIGCNCLGFCLYLKKFFPSGFVCPSIKPANNNTSINHAMFYVVSGEYYYIFETSFGGCSEVYKIPTNTEPSGSVNTYNRKICRTNNSEQFTLEFQDKNGTTKCICYVREITSDERNQIISSVNNTNNRIVQQRDADAKVQSGASVMVKEKTIGFHYKSIQKKIEKQVLTISEIEKQQLSMQYLKFSMEESATFWGCVHELLGK
ncbi:predicted protein [Naegleria gruberi]|uniref:Predicted protein n=1 Tax=Naegleria gruberi TaxID=5762 RepID=D2W4P9_NAEGR|nr:uncharacterized protein NAEGRDRAFT_76384 [Naegleria gruberi]EFC35955.1 predicted protein [Naegleria gruberi]|eukprot:XP_002668699.1 predicted protein [Naegleria gruberi strain NEG-M]